MNIKTKTGLKLSSIVVLGIDKKSLVYFSNVFNYFKSLENIIIIIQNPQRKEKFN